VKCFSGLAKTEDCPTKKIFEVPKRKEDEIKKNDERQI
jgi:hypothetical protein